MGRRGTGLGGRRCLIARCGRTVRPGRAVCVDCRRTGKGRDLERALGRLADELGQAAEGEASRADRAKRTAAAVRRLAMSEEGALVAERLEELAAEARTERKLEAELELLRAAMGRMILEEEDAVRLADGVGKAALMAARLMQVQAELGKGRQA